MNSRLSKVRSVHITYVMPRTVYFGWICKRIFKDNLDKYTFHFPFSFRKINQLGKVWKFFCEINFPSFSRFLLPSEESLLISRNFLLLHFLRLLFVFSSSRKRPFFRSRRFSKWVYRQGSTSNNHATFNFFVTPSLIE